MTVPEWIKLLAPYFLELMKIIFGSPKQAAKNVIEKRALKAASK